MALRISRRTERPPTPESNIPTGAPLTSTDFPPWRLVGVTASRQPFSTPAVYDRSAVFVGLRAPVDLGPERRRRRGRRSACSEHAQVRLPGLEPGSRPGG